MVERKRKRSSRKRCGVCKGTIWGKHYKLVEKTYIYGTPTNPDGHIELVPVDSHCLKYLKNLRRKIPEPITNYNPQLRLRRISRNCRRLGFLVSTKPLKIITPLKRIS